MTAKLLVKYFAECNNCGSKAQIHPTPLIKYLTAKCPGCGTVHALLNEVNFKEQE